MEPTWSALDDIVPALRRFLDPRCRDRSERDDVVQETLLRAARHRDSLSDPRKLRSWVFRIGANVLADHVRRESRRRQAEGGDELLPEVPCPATVDEPGEELRVGDRHELRDEVLAVLTEALADLRDRDRRLLDSYYGGAGSCRETAADCGVAPELVKVHLYRARRRLRTLVTRRFERRNARADLAGSSR